MTGIQESRAVPNLDVFELRVVAVNTRGVNLGEDIKQARERLQMTQLQLAHAVGVGKSTVSNWERGASFPKNRLALVREILKLDPATTYPVADEQDVLPAADGADEERVLRGVSDAALLAEVARRFGRGRETSTERRGRGEHGTLPDHLIVPQPPERRISDSS